MPRHVRNFWIEVSADGVQPIATGPRSGSGGARVIIRQRSHGTVDAQTVEVACACDEDGNLTVDIYRNGEHIGSKVTER